MFGQQRTSSLQPTSRPSAPPADDLAIIRTFPYEKAAIGPMPIHVLSLQTHPSSKTITPRLDYETITRTQSAKKEPPPQGSWSYHSKFRSGESSRMKLLQRVASTASSSSSRSLRKLGIATWPSRRSRKVATKITISAVLPEPLPKRSYSHIRIPSPIVDDPDPHDISAQYFGSSPADQSINDESEPGATSVWNTASEVSSDSEDSILPVNSDPHDSKRVEQQRRLAYHRLTGGDEYRENTSFIDSLHTDHFKHGAQVILAEEELLQHGALDLRREGHLSIISEHRSEYESAIDPAYNTNADTRSQPAAANYISSENEAFSKFLRACAENAGSPPTIPNKSPSRQLRDFGALEKDREDGSGSTISPSEITSAEEHHQTPLPPLHEPNFIAPTPLYPALPHFRTIEEAEAYRRSQESKHTSPSSHALAKWYNDVCANNSSQTESTEHFHSYLAHGSSLSSQLALKLPDISRDGITKYSDNTSNALTSARTSSTSLSPTEKARLLPEPLNLRSLTCNSIPRSSSYAPPPPPPPPPSPVPVSPPQSKDGDGDSKASEYETRSSEGDSVQLHFENPGLGTNADTDTDTDPKLTKIQSNSSSSKSNKELIHEETGLTQGMISHRQTSAEKKSQSQSQSKPKSLDPDVKERQDWYGREVRLRVERIRKALRTKSFYSGGSL